MMGWSVVVTSNTVIHSPKSEGVPLGVFCRNNIRNFCRHINSESDNDNKFKKH